MKAKLKYRRRLMLQLERWLALSLDDDMGSEMGALQEFLEEVNPCLLNRARAC